jgi:spermidine synthase
VGGLGLGYTLRATLALVSPGARVVVAELLPEVVAWHAGPLAVLGVLADARVEVVVGDVLAEVRRGPGRFDTILLDVDNGPMALSHPANEALYSLEGLRLAHAALLHGGRLAIWSAAPHPGFLARLAAAGFDAREVTTGAQEGSHRVEHCLYLADRA